MPAFAGRDMRKGLESGRTAILTLNTLTQGDKTQEKRETEVCHVFFFKINISPLLHIASGTLPAFIRSNKMYTEYTQKNDAVSKVNKKFISHLTRAQRTPSAAATFQVSHALPAVRFSCLLRGPLGQFPRWRRSRKRLSVCSVLRCPDL